MGYQEKRNRAVQTAIKMFERRFVQQMKNKDVEAFKKDYATLYSDVIIPALSEQCEMLQASVEVEAGWERLMMELVGEDGPGSVRTAIEQLKLERDAYLFDVEQLRETIKELQEALESARQAGELDMKNGDKPASEMTKREYFASIALNGLLAFEGTDNGLVDPKRRFNCKTAVRYADSMLEAFEYVNK